VEPVTAMTTAQNAKIGSNNRAISVAQVWFFLVVSFLLTLLAGFKENRNGPKLIYEITKLSFAYHPSLSHICFP